MNHNKTIQKIHDRLGVNTFLYYLSKFFLTKPFVSPYVYSDYSKKDSYVKVYKVLSIIKLFVFKFFYMLMVLFIASTLDSLIKSMSFFNQSWLNLNQKNILFSVWLTFLYLGNYESKALQFSKTKKLCLLSFKIPFLEVYQASLFQIFVDRIVYACIVFFAFIILGKSFPLALAGVIFVAFFCYYGEIDTLSYFHKHKKGRTTLLKTGQMILFSCFIFLLSLSKLNTYLKFSIALMSMLLYILRKQHDYQQLKTSEFINTIMIQNIRNADELLATVSNQSLTHVQVDQEVDVEASQSYLTQSKGYSYFNNLFMNRHRRIWLKPLKILTFLVFSFACLLTGLLFYIQNIDPNAKAILGDGDVFESVYFLFTKAFLLFYYFTNIGEKITQAYYINADYSLLHYSFYRRKEVIWRQYLSRVKSSIYIGIVPVMTLTVFLIIWKVMVPSSSTLNLFSFIINLFIISMFFNLHYLFMYYLLSPFNLKLEAKSIPYNLSKIIIYLFVFNSSEFLAKPQSFIYMSVFFVLYTLCSIVLVRLFAHKTFTYKD